MFSEWILNWDSGGWEVSLILLPRVKSVIAFFLGKDRGGTEWTRAMWANPICFD